MFKFSIRDLFWLTLVACFAFGWYVDRQTLRAKAKEIYDAGKNLEELRGGPSKGNEIPLPP